MGLDTTHDGWHGPYSAFRRFRVAVALAADYPWYDDLDAREWDGYKQDNFDGVWESYPTDPLLVFLVHSDCDGSIPADIAIEVAVRLEEISGRMPDESHGASARQFGAGLRKAAALAEPLEFW